MERKHTIIVIAVVIVILLSMTVYWLYVAFSRQGKLAVEVIASPSDSRITIDGQPASTGTVYLTPGEHIFTAAKEGFVDDRQVVEVSESTPTIGLIPTAKSAEALQWVRENNAERESIGGKLAQQRGQSLREKYPFVKDLPYAEIAGPFIIQYMFDSEDSSHIFINIYKSTPDGREKAFKWLRSKGYEPTDYDIRYLDFRNPLTEES